jgi:hypothetical protein
MPRLRRNERHSSAIIPHGNDSSSKAGIAGAKLHLPDEAALFSIWLAAEAIIEWHNNHILPLLMQVRDFVSWHSESPSRKDGPDSIAGASRSKVDDVLKRREWRICESPTVNNVVHPAGIEIELRCGDVLRQASHENQGFDFRGEFRS